MQDLLSQIPGTWQAALTDEVTKPYFCNLMQFLTEENRQHSILPPEDEIYAALSLTPLEQVRVLLLGQDPYPTAGHAHGLCFSVKPGVKHPASLRNIFKEMHDDIGCRIPNHGCLESWARQGILLLNTVLTVREGQANSHSGKGWEQFTDAIIRSVDAKSEPVVFVLWGNYAQKKEKLIDTTKHTVLKAAHPSPLSFKKFQGSRPFSAINDALQKQFGNPIHWQLDDIQS